MQYRTVISFSALALAACAAQTAREPVSTTSVTSAALRVEPKHVHFETGPAPQDTPETFGPIERRFVDALAKNPALRGVDYEHIAIEQSDGNVVLRGSVPTVADAVQVEMTIRQLRGVTSVDNRLRAYLDE